MGTVVENSSNKTSRVLTLSEAFVTMSYGTSTEDLSALKVCVS